MNARRKLEIPIMCMHEYKNTQAYLSTTSKSILPRKLLHQHLELSVPALWSQKQQHPCGSQCSQHC